MLQKIQDFKSPIDKFRLLSASSNLIVNAITEHYADVEFEGKSKKLSVDADTMLTIVLYVVIKAKVPDLWGHIKLSNLFNTKFIR